MKETFLTCTYAATLVLFGSTIPYTYNAISGIAGSQSAAVLDSIPVAIEPETKSVLDLPRYVEPDTYASIYVYDDPDTDVDTLLQVQHVWDEPGIEQYRCVGLYVTEGVNSRELSADQLVEGISSGVFSPGVTIPQLNGDESFAVFEPDFFDSLNVELVAKQRVYPFEFAACNQWKDTFMKEVVTVNGYQVL